MRCYLLSEFKAHQIVWASVSLGQLPRYNWFFCLSFFTIHFGPNNKFGVPMHLILGKYNLFSLKSEVIVRVINTLLSHVQTYKTH